MPRWARHAPVWVIVIWCLDIVCDLELGDWYFLAERAGGKAGCARRIVTEPFEDGGPSPPYTLVAGSREVRQAASALAPARRG